MSVFFNLALLVTMIILVEVTSHLDSGLKHLRPYLRANWGGT